MGYNKKMNLKQNMQAIALAFELEGRNVELIQEQRDVLEKYTGFGGLSCILKPCDKIEDKDSWLLSEKDLFENTVELYKLIRNNSSTEDTYKSYVSSLKESKLTAFFTPRYVIDVLWKSFKNQAIHFDRILDPSAGTGAFLHGFGENRGNVVCFEKDLITAKILRLLHPKVEIHACGFEAIEKYNNNYFDIVLSNIPFGNFKVYDPDFINSKDDVKKRSCSKIHNYFFIKAIDVVREGGIIAFITSQGVLNTLENRLIRERIVKNCNLLSVIRLPNDLFIDTANTEVGSDLIILQKNTPKDSLSLVEEAFIETRTLPNGCNLNNYFMDFSRVVHTKVEVSKDQYGQPGINFYYEKSKEDFALELGAMLDADIEERINKDLYMGYEQENNIIIGTENTENNTEVVSDTIVSLYDLFGIPEEERTQLNVTQKTKLMKSSQEDSDALISNIEDPFTILRSSKKPCLYKGEFETYYTEGTIVQFKGQIGFLSIKKERQKDEIVELHMFNPIEVSITQSVILKNYISLRNAYFNLFNFEYEYKQESISLRKEFNREYEEFTNKYGNLNNKENYKLIITDKHGIDMLSLEFFENGHKQLADIFKEPVSFEMNNEIKGLSPTEALSFSLNKYGYPHFPYMTSVSNKSREELINNLKGIIYYNPLLQRYEVSTHFISGDVVEKAERIEEYINTHPKADDIDKSKQSLQVLIDSKPESILFSDIIFNFGERWIPEEYYNKYMSELFATTIYINYFKDLDDFNIIADCKDTIEIKEKYVVKPSDSNNLDGLSLLSHALLNTQPKITKGTGRYNASGKEIRVTDTEAIQQANIKIDEIRSGFSEWLDKLADESKEELARLYNRKFNSRIIPKYDGSFQTFPDLRLDTLNISKPYDGQYNTVWMLKSNMGGLVDHEVGSGKTLTICIAAHEMKRLKMIEKPLILGKKGNIFEIASTYAKAYPNDRILYPSEKDFEPKHRKYLFSRIKNNNWDVIIMTHDQFFKIPQSLEVQFEILQTELDSVEENLKVAESLSGKSASNAMLKGLEIRQKNLKAALQEIYGKMEARKDLDVVDFKTMGIDHIFLDESHVFKNLMFNTRYRNVAGLGNPIGSQRALNLLYAIRTIQDKFDRDLCATFLSGTTISNSLVELYLIFKYLRPRALEAQDIRTFDAWAAVYTIKKSDYEFTVTNEIKSKERFRYFKNVPELANFYNEITDYKRAEYMNIIRPKNNIILYTVKQTPEQIEFQKGLIEFARTGEGKYIGRDGMDYKEARSGRMLIVTDLARKAAIDLRLINTTKYHGHPDNKISQAANKITEYYYKYDEQKGTQFVFSDIGTYKPDKWNVYSELKRKLVEDYRLPANEIRFIQEATNTKQRQSMIADFKVGKIRILIGHTESLGTGVDAPQKCVAIHNLSMPWTPKDLDQRGGRGARKGNEIAPLYTDNKVDNYMYASESSLDTYMFNLLQNKQTFITQLKTNSLGTRVIDEGAIDAEGNMNYSEFVAILSGNSDLLDKAKLEKKVYAMESELRSYNKQLHNTEFTLKNKKLKLRKDQDILNGIRNDWEIINEKLPTDPQGNRPNPIQLNNFEYNTNLISVGERLLEIEKIVNTGGYLEPIGKLLNFNILVQTKWQLDGNSYNLFFIEGAYKYSFNNGYLAKTPELAASNFVRALDKIPSLLNFYEKENTQLQDDIIKLEVIVNTPWKKDAELKRMKLELDRLNRQIQRDLKDLESMHNEDVDIVEDAMVLL